MSLVELIMVLFVDFLRFWLQITIEPFALFHRSGFDYMCCGILVVWLQTTIKSFAFFHRSGFDYIYITAIFHR